MLLRINGKPQALPKCYETQLQHGNKGDFYGFHRMPVTGDKARSIRKPERKLDEASRL